MKDELENKIIADFPSLFRDCDKTEYESCMAWGCEIGDGWYNLLYKLCEDLMKTPGAENLKFDQIKEKFGMLRVYYSGGGSEAGDLVDNAEIEADKVCSYCGSREHRRENCEGQTPNPPVISSKKKNPAESLKHWTPENIKKAQPIPLKKKRPE